MESSIFVLENPFTVQFEYFVNKISLLQAPTPQQSPQPHTQAQPQPQQQQYNNQKPMSSNSISTSTFSPAFTSHVAQPQFSNHYENVPDANAVSKNLYNLSQMQANEFMRALANNNAGLTECPSLSNFPMTPMTPMLSNSQMSQLMHNNSESNDLMNIQRYHWMS